MSHGVRQYLSGFPGVQAVARGLARVDGTWTREVAWLVFVRTKRPRATLRPHERIPRRVDGVRIDVLDAVSPVCTADGDGEQPGCGVRPGQPCGGAFAQEIRPLQAGYSLGLKRRTGTLGLVVAPARGEPRPLLLSSSHVLNRRADGDRYALYQPGGRDRRAGSGAPVAWAWRYTRLHPKEANCTEGALAEVRDDVPVETRHPLGEVRGVEPDVPLGATLFKVSRTTGYAKARLVAKGWSGRVRIGSHRYRFRDQWVVDGGEEPVSLSGDSGAVWLTSELTVAAMNFAGGTGGTTSISMPADRLFRRLGIRIPTRSEGERWRAKSPPV